MLRDHFFGRDHELIKAPRSAVAAQVLILINALFWFLFSIVAALGNLPSGLATGPIRWTFAFLALGTSIALGGIAYFLVRQKKAAFYLALAVLALLGVLSITDEVGFLDIFTLTISVAAIILIVKNRDWYLKHAKREPIDRAA